ncbi:MAG: tRNA adenosine(34) deaminase TadA [Deltaproteobacteria bacterium]|jgi:tRNA(adenine34) deaminase|nr:tRNA adenosine(34) deaminase TadA [Deltaproteobacteria bacterium]
MIPDRIIPTPPPGWTWKNLMAEALAEAGKARELGEVPIGAVLVEADGTIIGRGHNQPVSSHNPAAHAEIMAICAAASRKQNYRLNGAVLLVTLEPCLMCAGAIVHARLDGVVYGAKDPKAGVVESRLDGLDLNFHNHRVWHMGGILEAECAAILDDFFRERR